MSKEFWVLIFRACTLKESIKSFTDTWNSDKSYWIVEVELLQVFLLLDAIKSLSTFGDSLNKHSPVYILFITASFNSFNVIPVMPFNESIHLVLCLPRLLVPSTFTSITSFSIPQACIACLKKVRARLTTMPSREVSGLISSKQTYLFFFLSKVFSAIFASTIVQKHQFFISRFS